MKRLFVDMDGVLAEYRRGCKPEDLMKKGYFLSLKPEWNMLGALKRLAENSEELGISVCVLTKVYPSMFKHSVSEKLQWRDKYLPELFDSEFVMVNGDAEEKSEVVREMIKSDIDGDCVLIDDYNPNLREWLENGGTPVKYVNGINDKKRSFTGSRLSFDMSEEELYNAILALLFKKAPAPAAA